jgi:hypothetical protein
MSIFLEIFATYFLLNHWSFSITETAIIRSRRYECALYWIYGCFMVDISRSIVIHVTEKLSAFCYVYEGLTSLRLKSTVSTYEVFPDLKSNIYKCISQDFFNLYHAKRGLEFDGKTRAKESHRQSRHQASHKSRACT